MRREGWVEVVDTDRDGLRKREREREWKEETEREGERGRERGAREQKRKIKKSIFCSPLKACSKQDSCAAQVS